jgi:hypothetical protein
MKNMNMNNIAGTKWNSVMGGTYYNLNRDVMRNPIMNNGKQIFSGGKTKRKMGKRKSRGTRGTSRGTSRGRGKRIFRGRGKRMSKGGGLFTDANLLINGSYNSLVDLKNTLAGSRTNPSVLPWNQSKI